MVTESNESADGETTTTNELVPSFEGIFDSGGVAASLPVSEVEGASKEPAPDVWLQDMLERGASSASLSLSDMNAADLAAASHERSKSGREIAAPDVSLQDMLDKGASSLQDMLDTGASSASLFLSDVNSGGGIAVSQEKVGSERELVSSIPASGRFDGLVSTASLPLSDAGEVGPNAVSKVEVESGREASTAYESTYSLQSKIDSGAAASSLPLPEEMRRRRKRFDVSPNNWRRIALAVGILGLSLSLFFLSLLISKKSVPHGTDKSFPATEFYTDLTPTSDSVDNDDDNPVNIVPGTVGYARPRSRHETIKEYLKPVADTSSLEVNDSAQSRAALWMATDSKEMPDPDDYESNIAHQFIERWVLAVFFHSTGGDGWIHDIGFMSDKSICEWNGLFVDDSSDAFYQAGIFCNEDLLVGVLHLPNSNNLVGTLPKEMSLLRNMVEFNINHNSISGPIPSSVTGLVKLRKLSLMYNDLTGSIPDSIGSLGNLEIFELSNNFITGTFPESMSGLIKLERLAVDDNLMAGDFQNLKSLIKMKTLFLEDNNFTGYLNDGSFDSLSNLIILDVSDNFVKGSLPSSLLDPTEFPRLILLDVNGNNLKGNFPSEFPENNVLNLLLAHDNLMDGSIENVPWSNLKTLTHLDLSSNDLTGNIPSTLGNLNDLYYLFLANNTFTPGPIPEFLPKLTKLMELSLKNTDRTGTIPPELGSMQTLFFLDLDDNALTKTVPQELSQLTNLVILLLNRNQLTGALPAELEALSSLQVVFLQKNTITNAEAICKNTNLLIGALDCGDPGGNPICSCCTQCCDSGDDKEQCDDEFLLANYNPMWEYSYQRHSFEFGDQDIVNNYIHL
eukprot:CAMPEP_0195508110 /NCGR_PEP_ID=MMETSP0794_2-20130614/1407_1 /TAXON_ID=515487 /ORGANISM="Stephanopyxis turris, Strain CCMP 815" /LENGTH=849 /DNA_ID=CAMNT_0040634985 /DNA_START=22 /DNA_END=2571 /DNA_ORIENTATION=+